MCVRASADGYGLRPLGVMNPASSLQGFLQERLDA